MSAATRYIATEAAYAPDKYYRYAELTRLLEGWAEQHANLMQVESIGRSYEGRDIWGVTLTNRASGPASEKPAYHVDANIHAGEVTGSSVVLYTINWLLSHHGGDARATFVLDNLALYLVPRICVDGAELYLTTPALLRSSVRPYPDRDEEDGLLRKDLDGDGFITAMRVRDPTGPWKQSAKDDRLLIPRAPDEVDGAFYHVYPEGEVVGSIRGGLAVLPPPYGLDLNRNFPVDWVPDSEQPGAGPYPFSEPETRALADWLLSHPNVSGSQHYHTWSGIIIRPSSFRTDEALPLADARAFHAFDAIGREETGYPAVSIWDGFNPIEDRPRGGIKGTDLDWVYEQLGIFPYTTELWNIYAAAGVEIDDYMDFHRNRSEEDELRALRWADQHIPGEGFIPWRPFQHPQLGLVEIGGWTYKFTHQNPPGPFLETIAHGNMLFTLRCAMAAPRVKIRELTAERIGGDAYHVRAVLENLGFLPTWVSEQARRVGKAEPVTAALTGDGVRLVSGKGKQTVGELNGWGEFYHALPPTPRYSNRARAEVEWVVSAPAGTAITVTSESRSGGGDRQTITLA